MSIFSSIKDAIFGHKAQAAEVPAPAIPMEQTAPAAATEPCDVEATCASMTGSDALNWQTSIVDLMKLVGIDASYDNRKSLAHELGNADYAGSAEDNIALHKQVMNALAQNGGKVPAALLG
jgi:Domain of unknown function (DUF3597)